MRKIAGAVCFREKIREQRLKWYGHVMRREDKVSIKKALEKPVIGNKSRGKERKRWKNTIKHDSILILPLIISSLYLYNVKFLYISCLTKFAVYPATLNFDLIIISYKMEYPLL